jgi:hypothetical protein
MSEGRAKSDDSLLGLLAQLAELSDLHGFSWHADYIRKTADAFRHDVDLGWDHLASVQFWGGAGSIADTDFNPADAEWHRQNGRPVPSYLNGLREEDYAADRRSHMTLLARIANELNRCTPTENGLRWLERAKVWGETFEKWLTDPRVMGS